jgi:hypothetical protein
MSWQVHIHEHAVAFEPVVQMMMGVVDSSVFAMLMAAGKDGYAQESKIWQQSHRREQPHLD